jgi:hypothetical protein
VNVGVGETRNATEANENELTAAVGDELGLLLGDALWWPLVSTVQ